MCDQGYEQIKSHTGSNCSASILTWGCLKS